MLDDQDYFDYFPDQLGVSFDVAGGTVAPPNGYPYGILPNSGNKAGYMDLAYWNSRGVPTDQIFDVSTGQLRNGWSRTGSGYERTGGVTPPTTGGGGGEIWTTTGGGAPRGTFGDDWGYLTEPFTGKPPAWQSWAPSASPSIVKPPKFEFKQFEAPTMDSIYADPSYQFRKGEGEKALAQRIASTGAYRTGGTLKDFINYNQNAASQEYGNIFGRAVDAHNLGLNQALGTYATNWGVDRDALDREIDIWGAQNTAMQRENENQNRRNLDNFLAEFDIFDRNKKRVSDALFGAAGLGG